ncbi:hypothetical protein QU878_02080, partial [Escherichia coli]
ADRNRSHWSTSKTPSYTKSVSWQHHLGRAWDAQLRLCKRYRKLQAKGKNINIRIVAVARELSGFIWDMGRIAMSAAQQPTATSPSVN